MKTLLITVSSLILFVGVANGKIEWGITITNEARGIPTTPPFGIPVSNPNAVKADYTILAMCSECRAEDGYDELKRNGADNGWIDWGPDRSNSTCCPEYVFWDIFSYLPEDDNWLELGLIEDWRPWGEPQTYDVRLICKSAVPEVNGVSDRCPNFLLVNYATTKLPDPCNPFEGKCVYLYSDRLLYGYAVDVKALIASTPYVHSNSSCPGGHKIELLPLTRLECPVSYHCNHHGCMNDEWNVFIEDCSITVGQYGTVTVIVSDICPMFSTSSSCFGDFANYTILAQDWGKPQGKYYGDISGENGIPDGYVDFYDLAEFVSAWLGE